MWNRASQRVLIEEVEIHGNYWIAQDRKVGGKMIMDIGCEKQIDGFFIRNTHNGNNNDRATKGFTISLWNTPTSTWRNAVTDTSVDVRSVRPEVTVFFPLANVVGPDM